LTTTTNQTRLGWDHSTHDEFYRYYSQSSESKETYERFKLTQAAVLRVIGKPDKVHLDVADIGCGAGTQCLLWAGLGHRVQGLDVNGPLIELARKRSEEHGLSATFQVGTATQLPWPDASFDVCLVPELLEHVAPWKQCVEEFARVLRPGGVLFLSTTNKLCPKQQEFNLVGYSWYPALVKRYVEHLAMTTQPQLANFATYPAVNWFSFYQLRDELAPLGLTSLDRFDTVDDSQKSPLAQTILRTIRLLPPVRFLAHVLTPYTWLIACKNAPKP
jgi:2-polyprenyl-3-methyl-5-hydroxy-6-metoxy-1,4-benzoquinol methylase